MSRLGRLRRRRPADTPQWRIPTFPMRPRDTPTVEVVDDAFLSRVEHGPLRTYQRPHRYLRGAVYDGGRLVVSSQKIGGLRGHPWVPADAMRTKVNPGVPGLAGRWLYGGHWVQHFGHFLVETVTTLWPDEPDVEGLVFHQYLRRPVHQEGWMLRALELAGHGGRAVEVVGRRHGLRVDQLVVPSRTVVANGWGHPQAREVWERMAAPFASDAGGPPRLFLSRTSHNEQRRREGHARSRSTLERDRRLDDVFARAGFEVVEPERLAFDDQLRLVARAEVIAGNSGSALHLSAFAPRGTRVLEIGDERNPGAPVELQRIIDRLSGHPHAFVRGDRSPKQVAAALGALGL